MTSDLHTRVIFITCVVAVSFTTGPAFAAGILACFAQLPWPGEQGEEKSNVPGGPPGTGNETHGTGTAEGTGTVEVGEGTITLVPSDE